MKIELAPQPPYSKRDEILNSTSHFIGFIFAIVVLILFIVHQNMRKLTFIDVYPLYIYVFFMGFMFFMSGFYHSRRFNTKARAVCRLIDHCDIYLFVAGTYTPICLLGINNQSFVIALMVIEWSLAAIGIILSLISLENKITKTISYFIYLIGGWAIAIFFPFNIGLPFLSFIFILMGGIAYTIGAIVYAIGKEKRIWLHTIFHVFVLIAAILQFVGIWFLL